MSAPDDFTAQISFPRLSARTQRFTLGVPRNVRISGDGTRVHFVRTPSGTSRTGCLWEYDVATRQERLLVDPRELLGDADEELSAQERARRERSRESGGGIVGFATDDAARLATFALSGRLWVSDLSTGGATALPSVGSVIDPRLDPTGRHVAYASGGALRVIGADGALDHALVEPDGENSDDVVWGQAEFVAAEEMERYNGFWWAPDGRSLLVERYDNSPVAIWHLADPSDPTAPPVPNRYPAAGTANADVTLWHVGLDGHRAIVNWNRDVHPYLTRVSWTSHGPPLVQVMSRDQRRAEVLAFDVDDAATRVVRTQTDDVWVDLVVGVPAYGPGGRLVTCEDSDDTKRVVVDGTPISPVGLHVRGVLGTDDTGVLVSASVEPTEVHIIHVSWDGEASELTDGPGVNSGSASAGTSVITRSGLDATAATVTVWDGDVEVGEIANLVADPGFVPSTRLLRAGEHDVRTAVLFPRGHVPGSSRLPVLMDPYGGPHAQRVLASARAFLQPQWLADQGFCVVVADGRGTPARGHDWERAVRDNFAGVTLMDQVDALDAVAAAYPDDVDTDRVGITGWSYGGYLAALAVLRRPDVFHAAVAGAPVTEMRLYDTFYTERYLGHPDEQPAVYDANSLLVDAETIDGVNRPLMIIHGMADDNVVVAHTLRLSSALLAAGRPHHVLPLTGVTHMASQEVVAENLALLQVDFLRQYLRL